MRPTVPTLLVLASLLATPALAQSRPLVMIDPGHGGDAIGVEHDGLLEKDLVLRLGFIMGEVFVARGFDVRFTRTGDYDVPWAERRSMAEASGADVLLMLHFNGNDDTSLRGAEIRVHMESDHSVEMAEVVANQMMQLDAPAVVVNRDWPFLQSPTVATVMIEAAYMTNAVDRERVVSVAFYRQLAELLADGIEAAGR